MAISIKNRNESYLKVHKNRNRRHKLIIDFMKANNKGYTARVLATEMFNAGLLRTSDRNQVHPRLNELVNGGVIQVIGKTYDELMCRNVSVYVLNDNTMISNDNKEEEN